MMNRRALLISLGAGALSPLSSVIAQQPPPARVGWISLDQAGGSPFFEQFRAGLRDLGWVEGRNLTIEARWAEGSMERLEQVATELVALKPHAIVTQGGALRPFRRIDTTVPIVFGFSGDPVEAGYVQSLARPGRNLTGVSFLSLDLVGKRIELLKDVIPNLSRVAILANPEHPGDQAELRASEAVAKALGLTLEYFAVRGVPELEQALAAVPKARSEAVVVFPDAVLLRSRERIGRFGLEHRMPIISGWAPFAEGGCLMTYGPNLQVAFRRMAAHVDRILRGAKPAELPVELPTSVELVVNLKTAKALGLTIPPAVLARADELIR